MSHSKVLAVKLVKIFEGYVSPVNNIKMLNYNHRFFLKIRIKLVAIKAIKASK